MRNPRTLAIAAFVLVIALTPLSVVTSAGHFEYRYAARFTSDSGVGHGVVVEDRTGLVAGIGPALPGVYEFSVVNPRGNRNAIVVTWPGGSCDTSSRLVLEGGVDTILIRFTTDASWGCVIGMGSSHAIVIKLWSPVDAGFFEVVDGSSR
ncbi:MAG: hypothetical protein ABIP53_05185 [Candidatus Limnocylindrales bacterium]